MLELNYQIKIYEWIFPTSFNLLKLFCKRSMTCESCTCKAIFVCNWWPSQNDHHFSKHLWWKFGIFWQSLTLIDLKILQRIIFEVHPSCEHIYLEIETLFLLHYIYNLVDLNALDSVIVVAVMFCIFISGISSDGILVSIQKPYHCYLSVIVCCTRVLAAVVVTIIEYVHRMNLHQYTIDLNKFVIQHGKLFHLL